MVGSGSALAVNNEARGKRGSLLRRVGRCSAMRKVDIPDRLTFKEQYLQDVPDWINPGDSVIVDPDGKVMAGPAKEAANGDTPERGSMSSSGACL